MIHVLHVVVIFQEVDELFHVLDIGGVGQGNIVLGDHLHLGGGEHIALGFHGGGHGAAVVGLGVDGEALLFGLDVGSAAVQSIHHHGRRPR